MSSPLRSGGHAPKEPAEETTASPADATPASAPAPAAEPADAEAMPAAADTAIEAAEDPASPSQQAASRRRQSARLLIQTTQELPPTPTTSAGLKPPTSSSTSNNNKPLTTTASRRQITPTDAPPSLAAYQATHPHAPKLAVQAHAFATSLYASGAGTKRGDGVFSESSVGPPQHGPTALNPVSGFDSSPASRAIEAQLDEIARDAAARGDSLALFLATAGPKSVDNSNGMAFPKPEIAGGQEPEQSSAGKARRVLRTERGRQEAKSSGKAGAVGGQNDGTKDEKNDKKTRGLKRQEQKMSGNPSSEETSGNASARPRTAYTASSEVIVLNAPSTGESVAQKITSSPATDVQPASSVTTPRRETLQDLYERLEQEGERDGMADVPALRTRSSRKCKKS